MYSVWLLPKKEDDKYLSKIIRDLSQKYGGSIFPPHITAFGDIETDLDIIVKTVKNSMKNMMPFSVKKLKIEFSDYIFKASYLSLEINTQLEQINKRLSYILDQYNKYSFQPHISLLYKIINESARKKITNEIKIKNDYIIDRIAVAEISERVEDWKIPYVSKLDAIRL